MQIRLCPFCGGKILPAAVSCIHCGGELHSMKKARPYQTIRDGLNYGVAFGGEVKIHGLTLKKALELVEILNSVEEAKSSSGDQ